MYQYYKLLKVVLKITIFWPSSSTCTFSGFSFDENKGLIQLFWPTEYFSNDEQTNNIK